MSTTGSVRRLSLNGIGFGVFGDANFSKVPGVLNEAVPTSGENVHKVTKQVGMVSGVVVDGSDGIANGQIHDLHNEINPFTMSYTKANGDVLTGTGKINIESDETEEGRITISLIPTTEFELIPA
jgi:hypothetical protein